MYFPEFENVLNVSLNVPEEERMRSEILNTGYSPAENSWELVVRYSVFPERFLEMHPEIVFDILAGNYMLMRVPERLLGELAQTPGVIYIEIPKRLYMDSENKRNEIMKAGNRGNTEKGKTLFSAAQVDSVQVSGIPLLRERLGINLTGRGVLVGIADSGIDIFHPAFRNRDGRKMNRSFMGSVLRRVYKGRNQRISSGKFRGAYSFCFQGSFRSWNGCSRNCGRKQGDGGRFHNGGICTGCGAGGGAPRPERQ